MGKNADHSDRWLIAPASAVFAMLLWFYNKAMAGTDAALPETIFMAGEVICGVMFVMGITLYIRER
ncbi:MAG TPA: hypothetical protein O0X27_05920 [Methanocorpusculum sp.]|nr:hypothetical protein [Methanocorpusculum sp.]